MERQRGILLLDLIHIELQQAASALTGNEYPVYERQREAHRRHQREEQMAVSRIEGWMG